MMFGECSYIQTQASRTAQKEHVEWWDLYQSYQTDDNHWSECHVYLLWGENFHVERNHKELARSSAIFVQRINVMLKIADFEAKPLYEPRLPSLDNHIKLD